MSEIRFADAADGWIYGSSQLESTHDGGAHWAPVTVPGRASQGALIQSLETGGGYAYALDIDGSGANPAPAALYRTPAGSDAWTALSGTEVAQAESGRVIVHGAAAWMVVQSGSGPTVFRALVAGSWVNRRLPCQRPGGEVMAAATSVNLGVVCAAGAAAGQQPKLPYLSSDGGTTWKPGSNAPISGDTISLALAGPGTLVIAAASGASWLYGSFDAGHTWATVEQDTSGGGLPWEDLGFTDTTQGVVIEGVVGSGGAGQPAPRLFFTRDGGHTWTPTRFA